MKGNNGAQAVQLFKELKATGHHFPSSLYTSIIHICIGGGAWEAIARKHHPAAAQAGVAQQLLQTEPKVSTTVPSGTEAAQTTVQGVSHAEPVGAARGADVCPAGAADEHTVQAEFFDIGMLSTAQELFDEIMLKNIQLEEATLMHMARLACLQQVRVIGCQPAIFALCSGVL